MAYWLMYIALGGVAGILAGLLGVGGGIVIVPALTFIFTAQRLSSEYTVHLAVGTSLATILFTSVASSRAHHGRGAVDWPIVRSISPGIVVGTLAGSWVAAQMTTRFLKGFFVAFIAYVALQMLLDIRPKPSRSLPGGMTVTGVGGIIGGVSSLVGIGGGSMSVPFLVWCNVAMHRAIGTSAAIGFPIAAAGAVGYVANGFAMPLPPLCVGFVYLPALVGVACASFITAPLGARMAHRLPVGGLKKIFAVLLLVTGAKLLAGFF